MLGLFILLVDVRVRGYFIGLGECTVDGRNFTGVDRRLADRVFDGENERKGDEQEDGECSRRWREGDLEGGRENKVAVSP